LNLNEGVALHTTYRSDDKIRQQELAARLEQFESLSGLAAESASISAPMPVEFEYILRRYRR
jgi:hypothetical protein